MSRSGTFSVRPKILFAFYFLWAKITGRRDDIQHHCFITTKKKILNYRNILLSVITRYLYNFDFSCFVRQWIIQSFSHVGLVTSSWIPDETRKHDDGKKRYCGKLRCHSLVAERPSPSSSKWVCFQVILLKLLLTLSTIKTDKRSSSPWELGKLQLDLEGEAHMMQILKIKNEKCYVNLIIILLVYM